MPENTAMLSSATDGGTASTVVSVQPREISESAFRALCAAGAGPAEAGEGGLAVLRAEVDAQNGLDLLEQLLDARWTEPVRAASTWSTEWAGTAIHELDCPDQPALRSALELIDLAVSGSPTEVRVSRTTAAGIPRGLWNDLILRRSATQQRTIIVAVTTATGTQYLSIHNGAVTSADQPPITALAVSLPPHSEGANTVVFVLPGTAEVEKLNANIDQSPLKVIESVWLRMYQLSRNYLKADQ